MTPQRDEISGRTFISRTGGGLLRIALLFGSGAVALTLILVPIAEREANERSVASAPRGVDMMATGSIARSAQTESYTIRRSVLQPSPDAVCIIRDTGERTGAC